MPQAPGTGWANNNKTKLICKKQCCNPPKKKEANKVSIPKDSKKTKK